MSWSQVTLLCNDRSGTTSASKIEPSPGASKQWLGFQFERVGNFKIFAAIFLKLDGGEAFPLSSAIKAGDTSS